jgi:carboxypeptidase PM20D1
VAGDEKDSGYGNEFLAFHDFLELNYPRVHSILKREKIGTYSLLYTWKGKHPEKKPVMLMAHMDVVPVETQSLCNWTEPCFEGVVKDGYIWGRGTLDNKFAVTGILEAIEGLLSRGFQPERDIYIAFGHDEETKGTGATQIAAYLKGKGIQFESILDEGGGIGIDFYPDIEKPIAMISVAEKGYLTLDLKVTDVGGHSSTPGHTTVVGRLSKAIYLLESNQFPMRLSTPVRQMLRESSKEIGGLKGFALGHPLLFSSFIKKEFSSNSYTSSLLQTTIATTQIEGGLEDNVMPTEASARVNFRILPGETVETVISRVRRIIHDKKVQITVEEGFNDPPKITSTKSEGYKVLKRTVEEVFGDVLVTPSLSITASDSRHYVGLTNNILRFVPITMRPEDTERIHGVNERISIEGYKKSVKFYIQYMLNLDEK